MIGFEAGSIFPVIGNIGGAAVGAIGGAIISVVASTGSGALGAEQARRMNDPPIIDKNYKLLAKPRLSPIKFAKYLKGHKEIKNFVIECKKVYAAHGALLDTNNRIFTARIKRNTKFVKKQEQYKALLKKEASKSITILENLHKKIKQKYKTLKVSKSWFLNARKEWAKKGFPKKFDKNLMKFGFNKGELKKIKNAILYLPINKLEFDFMSYTKTIIKLSRTLLT